MAANGSSIRIGMVGAGAIAQIAHLPVLRKLKGVEIELSMVGQFDPPPG